MHTEEFFTEPRPWGAAQPTIATGRCIVTRSRIYTKTGDDGTTGLLYGGRVSKGDELVDAYGDIDEAVAALGAARAAGLEPRLAGMVLRLQRELFATAADLAASPRQRRRLVPGISLVTAEMTAGVEQLIDDLVAERPVRPVFVVPGATQAGALLDLARAVVAPRRAPRGPGAGLRPSRRRRGAALPQPAVGPAVRPGPARRRRAPRSPPATISASRPARWRPAEVTARTPGSSDSRVARSFIEPVPCTGSTTSTTRCPSAAPGWCPSSAPPLPVASSSTTKRHTVAAWSTRRKMPCPSR